MCTLIILRRPNHSWPLLCAANRDERTDRPFLSPGRHWSQYPAITAGMDLAGGGTWLGCHDGGLLVAMLNRRGSLGPAKGKRSRGLLALEILAEGSLKAAEKALAAVDFDRYRSFNLIMANTERTFWCRWAEDFSLHALPLGFSLLAEGELNDPRIARIPFYQRKFAVADLPDPERGNFVPWQDLLCETASDGEPPRDYLFQKPQDGYGTVSSSIVGMAKDGRRIWSFRDRGGWEKT